MMMKKFKNNTQPVSRVRSLLQSEIVEVTGCTEPASVVFAFLTARRHLKKSFDPLTARATLTASSEVLRNASTAVVPFLNRTGLRTVVAAGLSSKAAPALAAGLAFDDGADLVQITRLMRSVSQVLRDLKCYGARASCGRKAEQVLRVVLAEVKAGTYVR